MALPRILLGDGAPAWVDSLAILGGLFLLSAGLAFGAVLRLGQDLEDARESLPEE